MTAGVVVRVQYTLRVVQKIIYAIVVFSGPFIPDHMVSFLFKFTHSMYPLISFAPTFRMSPACAPRVRSEHIPTRKRHRISLLGRARLVVKVLPSPVVVVVGVCRDSSESCRGHAWGLSGSGPVMLSVCSWVATGLFVSDSSALTSSTDENVMDGFHLCSGRTR